MKIKKKHTLESVPKTSLSVPKEHLRQYQTVYRTRIELLCLKMALVPFCFLLSFFFLFWVVIRISKLLSKEKLSCPFSRSYLQWETYRCFEMSRSSYPVAWTSKGTIKSPAIA